MIIWLDALLSPAMAFWITREFSVSAIAVGMRDAKNQEIFSAAKQANAIVMTKNADFVRLVENAILRPDLKRLELFSLGDLLSWRLVTTQFHQTLMELN